MPKRPSPREPESSQTATWAIYRLASRAQWLGIVEAQNADAAVKAAAIKFRTDTRKLIAVRWDSDD